MNTKNILSVSIIALAVLGCAVGAMQERQVRFTGQEAEFSFVKGGCLMKKGQYTDRSGRGRSSPFIKFIAVSDNGQTIGEWKAYCKSVAPNGTSSCEIHGEGTAATGGGMGCPGFQNFRVIQ